MTLVYTFKTLAEKAITADNFNIHVLLLDMSWAFDTINRKQLIQDLEEVLNKDELHLISILIRDVKIQVKHGNQTGEEFTTNIGSPQGDCASPIWFIYYLYKTIKHFKDNNAEKLENIKKDAAHDHNYNKKTFMHVEHPYCRHSTVKEFTINQQYADDISWASTNINTINNIKDTAPTILKERNLQVNEDKTELYTIGKDKEEKWKNCKYLGSHLNTEEDNRRRQKLTNIAFENNKTTLCSKISLTLRMKIFNARISSIFLYNSELWTLTNKMEKSINLYQRRLLRKIIKTRYINNESLYKFTEQEEWTTTIKLR